MHGFLVFQEEKMVYRRVFCKTVFFGQDNGHYLIGQNWLT